MQHTQASLPSVTETPSDGLESMPSAANPAAEHTTAVAEETVADTTAVSETETTLSPSPDEAVYTPVYNGQTVSLRASDREQITTLLQLGMKQRDFLPTYERLSFLAKEDGASSVKAWVEQLVQERETAYRDAAVQTYGAEAGERYYAMERRERERRYTARDPEEQRRQADERERQATNERLAAELIALQAQFPQYGSIRDVPQTVIDTALRDKIPLLDAHNRYTLAEQQRREREQAQSRAAASHSTGSLRGEQGTAPTPLDAFLAGLQRRV